MMPGDSLWFTTRSALFEPGDAAWEEVAAYAEPLRRFLARRYGWLPEADRDDLVQTVLLEIKEKLVVRHDRSRGRFRALLQEVVRRRVADRLRRDRPAPLEPEAAASLAAPETQDVEALDLETSLVEAVAACRDRFTQGPDRDPDVVYALADRIVHGRSNAEIARQSGVSVDRVNRLLRRGREAIFAALLSRELEVPSGPRLDRAVGVFQAALRRPAEAARLVEQVPDDDLRVRLDAFLARFQASLPHVARGGDGDPTGELGRGLALILDQER